MAFKNFASPHCHSSSSLDSASTPEAFAAWELEHETGALTVTDHGTLAGARKVYDLATGKKYKGKLTPILGLEAYFRDDDCPILKSFGIQKSTMYRSKKSRYVIDSEAFQKKAGKESADDFEPFESYTKYQKYYHLTMHFRDQAAYETAVRLLSFADARAEKHGSEYKPLFGWKELEEIGAQNTVFGSSCLIGMVQRHTAFGQRLDISEAYYGKLRSLVRPGNFYVEAFPHVCDRNWTSSVTLTYEDGSVDTFPMYRNLKTDRHDGIKAEDLAKACARSPDGQGRLLAVMYDRKWQDLEIPKIIKTVKAFEGFIVNECSAYSPDGDIQKPANQFVLQMAKKYGDKVLVSDDSHFTAADEKIVQDVKLLQGGQWRFANSYHRMSSEESWPYFRDVLGVGETEYRTWIDNSHEWRDGFKDFKFKPRKSLPTSFYPADSLTHTFKLIQEHGRQGILADPRYRARLHAEIELLHRNGTLDLLPYFMIDEEVCRLYQSMGLLTGPGRGSAAGLLLTYLLEITHVDPLKYGLSMERFMTLTRIASGKLPDIDQDLPHRDLLVDPENSAKGWLTDRFGDCVVQLSTDTTLKARSAVLDVHRILSPDRRVPEDVARLAHKFEEPPQGVADKDFIFGYDNNGTWVPGSIESDAALIEYRKKYPQEWETVIKCLGLTRSKSRHPCAFVIADEPIHNFIPTTSVGGVKVTQPTAAQVESSGGVKMDFLVVNSIRDIGNAIQMIQERNPHPDLSPGKSVMIDGKRVPGFRCVPFQGKLYDIWDLPENQPVFHDICAADTESVFQFGQPGAMGWLKHFNTIRPTTDGLVHKGLDSIESLAAFTALDRPGGLDVYVDNGHGGQHNMLVEFARRAKGDHPCGDSTLIPILQEMLPETYGVIVYQEQLTKIYQTLGQTSGEAADEFRVHVSKKQMAKVIEDKKVFLPGAVTRLGPDAAEKLWQMLEAWAAYGFNKSHAVCYVVIGYACAFLKHHFPLEWWTAVLRNADKDEITEKFWRHCGHLINLPDISTSGDSWQIVENRIQAPLSLLKGLGEVAHEEIVKYRPVTSVADLCQKVWDRQRREGTQVLIKKASKKAPEGFVMVNKLKPARTALGPGLLNKLVISGAMDRLFPADTPLLMKLQTVVHTNCRVRGDVLKDGVTPKKGVGTVYSALTALQQYQIQKQVLPPFSRDLLPELRSLWPSGLQAKDGKLSWKGSPVVDRHGLQYMIDLSPWPPRTSMTVAFVAYIQKSERKLYQQNTKERMILTMDVEGQRFEFVAWPDRDTGKMTSDFNQDFSGTVAVVTVNKYTEGKLPSVNNVTVIQGKLDLTTKEESPGDGDE